MKNITSSFLLIAEKREYESIKIGDQVWMAEDLHVIHYRNGMRIIGVSENAQWVAMQEGACCAYPDYADEYQNFILYNGYAVIDPRKLAPEGWHIPTVEEWDTLIEYLGGTEIAGGKLKEAGLKHWLEPNTGATNSRGFTAVPNGVIDLINGSPDLMGYSATYWALKNTDKNNENDLYGYVLRYNTEAISSFSAFPQSGFSARCVKD